MHKITLEYMDKEKVVVNLQNEEVASFCHNLREGQFCALGANSFYTDPKSVRYVYVEKINEMEATEDADIEAGAMGEEPAPVDGNAETPPKEES